MKITKGRLRQIIQEELSRVLKEQYDEEHNPDHKEVFMVVAQAYGKIEFWPNMLTPRMFATDEDAGQFASSQNSKPGASRTWFPLSVFDVETEIKRSHPQYGILALAADMHLEKRAASDNDMDTDNDGKVSAGEFKQELQDILDDLVDMSDLPWAIPDKDDRNIQYYMKLLADKAGFTAEEFVNPDSDIETGQLDALDAGFVQDKFDPDQPELLKRMNYETGDESGTIRVGTFKGDPVAVADTMGFKTWMR